VTRDPLRDPAPLIRRVYAYVAYRVGDGPEAEDVTSATFERALRYRTTYDPRRGEPVAWLLGIARRCLEDARTSRPAAPRDEPLEVEEDFAADAERRVMLADALSNLSERDRDLLALRYGSDLTARQIAGVMDMQVNAVEVALHRALARLRSELEEGREDDPTLEPRAGTTS
jgi:RNA polymerase sigma-70 factor (ECF subfamily)